MKVALYVPTLSGGGAEKVMLQLAEAFHQRGLEIELVVNSLEGEYVAQIPKKIQVVSLQSKRAILAITPLIKYLRTAQPDAVLSTLTQVNVMLILAKILSRSKTRVIVREASTLSRSFFSRFDIKKVVLYVFVVALYPFAEAIIAVSRGVADDLRRHTVLIRSKLHVVYNPLNFKALKGMASEPVDELWYEQIPKKHVVAVGRLTTAKNFIGLIEAFSLLPNELGEVGLLILGEGELRAGLEQKVKESALVNRVFLPGFVPNPIKFISRAEVFVLSSLWEGLPNVLLQALVLNKRVVATNCKSGPAEILEQGKYGDLIPANDPMRLKDALISALSSNKTPLTKVELADIQKKYNLTRIAEEYLQIILPQLGIEERDRRVKG